MAGCYHPLTIRNPKLVKNHVYDKTNIEVPCGHCPACKDVKRLGWFIRLYYEYLYCIAQGGFALYETLTYNNDNLPVVLSPTLNIPCFSVRDVQLYLKKVRQHIARSYPYLKTNGCLKYFLSMEYGGKTHRPHYHIVFFVSNGDISQWLFKSMVEHLWHDKGFTKAGTINNGFICGQGALSYCAKYVCKDIYEDCYFRKLDNRLQKFGFHREQYDAIFPHNMQSNNLGIYALEFDKYNDLDNFFLGNINLPDSNNGIKQYKLPLYYERKIFYDVHYRYYDNNCNCYLSVPQLSLIPAGCDYSPIYVLNELGLEMKERRAPLYRDAVKNVYNVCMSIPELPDVLQKLNDKFKTNFASIHDFQNHIKKELPLETFISYSLVYRGCKTCYVPSPSPCGSSPYYDYMLIHDMSRGSRPLSVDYDDLAFNIYQFNNIPHIADNYNMIRYIYYIIHLCIEHEFNKRELEYVEQKSVYLTQLNT